MKADMTEFNLIQDVTEETVQTGLYPDPVRASDISRRPAGNKVLTGLELAASFDEARRKILSVLNGTEEDWNSYQWQLTNCIRDLDVLQQIINLSETEIQEIEKVGRLHRWSISPFYASLMDPDDSSCPIRMQSLPTLSEILDTVDDAQALAFEERTPAPLITRLYDDRLIIKLTNMCTVFCRHCQRKKDIDCQDIFPDVSSVEKALDYIRENGEIRDVLLTGGDALSMSDGQLDFILTHLGRIPHVEIIRLGSRMPCVLPQRVTPQLCKVLEKHDPVYLNTQFNHPREITHEARKAVDMLTRAGVVVRDQTVLLKGVNDDAETIKKLMQGLLRIKVAPYYLFLCKRIEGALHFCTTVEEGRKIIEQLQGRTTGMAVPRLIAHVTDGRGKVPIYPRVEPPSFD